MRVNPHFLARRAGLWPLLVTVVLAGLANAWADQKVIRLRNELITTTPVDPATLGRQAVESPVTGLFVLQFTDKPQPAWVEELRNLNVSLLRYVPEDAFVVRLAGTHLNQLRKLPYVQWVGEYKPAHKVHSVFQLLGRTNGPVPVRVLLVPDANEEAVRGVKASLQKLTGEATSSFGTILSGDVLPAQVNALAQSHSILWMEPARKMKLSDEIATKIVAGGEAGDPARPNLADVHALGYDGRDVIVAVADSGLNNGDADTMHPDLAGRVDAFFFYRDLEDAADEHSHGTHVTGIIAGDGATGEADESGALYGLGVAPKAHIVAQRVFDAEGVDKLPAYDVLTRDAVRAGAVIGSNSWGDDSFGRYDLSAAQFDALVRDADPVTPGEQPYILEFSAGNSGPGAQTINTPAVAKNVIATGASQNNRFEFPIYAEGQESMADFSSRGPCEDGRIKPDVVAPGTWIASLQSESATDQFAWEAISPNYQFQGGTSQAGPHVSGCAAIFVQYYRQNHGGLTPSPAMVKAALINSAVDMGTAEIAIPGEEDEEDPSVIEVGDTGPAPNNDEGWGRVDLTQIIGSTRVTEYLDQTRNLITGQTYEKRVVVASRDEPLKITLTYTDVPGLPAAIPALVNDLDLEVVAPDGSLYRGNQFFNGESVAGVPVGDSVNNVEGVLVNEPAPGEWLVRVRARNVVEDIHHRTNQAPEQDFALVVSGDFPPAGAAVLFFDRDAYRLPVTAQVRLIDSDLAGQTSVTLKVTSTTEPAGETLILRSAGTPGVFTNGIALVEAGVVANDGRLQVTNETTIRVSYQDVNPQLERVASARVDSKPPVITDVIVTNRLGKVIIEWTTDEPATSVARFGTGGSLTQGLTNTALVSRHAMPLPPLTVGQTNQFLVISTDAAGNSTTNDNGGRFYTFVPRKGKPVLLVYATDSLFDLPPIDTYTSTLDVLGIEYDLWNLEEQPSPTADDLRPFDVVIWRAQELNLEGQTLTAPMQATIAGYVTNGGSLLMASMELCSRLTTPQDIAFRKGILHVEDFVTDAGATFVDGTAGDIIGDGLHLELDYSTYPDLFGFIVFEDLPDHLTISSNAAPIFREADTGQIVGLRYPKAGQDSVGRVVFCSFAMEAVSDVADAPNNRVTVLADILKFLSPSLQSASGIEFDSAAYTVPARATVELTDVNRSGAKQLEVTISSTSEAATQKLILDETARQGVFRGVIALVPVNGIAGAGKLRVKEADVIDVTYLDPTVNREIHASAIIDTVPPLITDVTSEPDYNETIVRWSSSKPADALVRFGETDGDPTFLNRTAYSGDFSTDHELLLTGLLPDRDYYFQVISRDAAGNAGVAGQQGSLFKFRTLKPIVAPWSDNFENGRSGWVVLNDDTAVDDETGENLLDAGWRLGQPANSLAHTAHSGNNAWGTNLRDESATFAISDLVSPAIELKTGNRATLRFWQMYDFQEKSEFLDLQAGIVAVTTNNGALWTTVYTPSDELVADWEEVEVDLSAYLGKVIRISFHYELFSFDVDEHPGWMIDDISISLTNSPVGNLSVTNNLAQAAFTVVGPVSYTGKGQLFQVTNAPPGEYRVAWSAVPYYNTPPSQTNSVSTNGPLVFTGIYTFADANNNDMSDAWEQAFFGGVSPTRTRQTDSDGDGSTDYAEFIAGTNPVDAGALLELGPPEIRANRTLSFSWPATPGRVYRLEGSLDLKTWEPYSDWVPASGNTASVILPPLDLRFPYFFRLQVRP